VLATVKLRPRKSSSSSGRSRWAQEEAALAAAAEAVDPILSVNLDRDPLQALGGGASSEASARRLLGHALQQTRLPDWLLFEAPVQGAILGVGGPAAWKNTAAGVKPTAAMALRAAPQAVLELTLGAFSVPRLQQVAASFSSYSSSSSALPALAGAFLTALQFAAAHQATVATSLAVLPTDAPSELLCRLASAAAAAAAAAAADAFGAVSGGGSADASVAAADAAGALFGVRRFEIASTTSALVHPSDTDMDLDPTERALRTLCAHFFTRRSRRSSRRLHAAVFTADNGALVPLEIAAQCLGWAEAA
jgi:hypothetical protein